MSIQLNPVHLLAFALEQDVQTPVAEPSSLRGQLLYTHPRHSVSRTLRRMPLDTRYDHGQRTVELLIVKLGIQGPIRSNPHRVGPQKTFRESLSSRLRPPSAWPTASSVCCFRFPASSADAHQKPPCRHTCIATCRTSLRRSHDYGIALLRHDQPDVRSGYQ